MLTAKGLKAAAILFSLRMTISQSETNGVLKRPFTAAAPRVPPASPAKLHIQKDFLTVCGILGIV
jgi:hypothetical protein